MPKCFLQQIVRMAACTVPVPCETLAFEILSPMSSVKVVGSGSRFVLPSDKSISAQRLIHIFILQVHEAFWSTIRLVSTFICTLMM